jgi:Holliday junction resolvase-like predicted endonuclease
VIITAEILADALLVGGRTAAAENFLLSQDADVPIFPESLVQVEVAKALRKLKFSGIEMEAATDRIVTAATGRTANDSDFPDIGRVGEIDIVCWNEWVPQVFVEVKDQISGSDDGIVADMLRLQEILRIAHRWGRNAPQAKVPRFGAIVYYVGKNAGQYTKGRHLASQLIPFASRTIATSLKNVQKIVDNTCFTLLTKNVRVADSAKDEPPRPELFGTEDEETVSGAEQLTYCVVGVLSEAGR